MKKIVITILTFVSFVFTTPLCAQESCFEQYLRENSKKILTAEDADDSYDELKKEVLARQVLQEENLFQLIQFAIDTITGKCHLLAQDGTVLGNTHMAFVDSTWYMWLSVDPLADKYSGNTPYMYCNGNPIMLIDPDGRKVAIKDGDIEYTYQPNASGDYGFYYTDADGSQIELTSSFALETKNALNTLRTKKWGRSLVDAAVKHSKTVWLSDNSGKGNCVLPRRMGASLLYDNLSTEGGLDIKGHRSRPSYIALAHELAHVISIMFGWYHPNEKWDCGLGSKNPNVDDKWATFMENEVRVEHGIPARQYYGIIDGEGVGLIITNKWKIVFPEMTAMQMQVYLFCNPISIPLLSSPTLFVP